MAHNLRRLIEKLPQTNVTLPSPSEQRHGCNCFSSPLARDCVLHVLQILEHLIVRARHALLDAIGREHAEPRVAAEERVPVGVCARPQRPTEPECERGGK